MSKLPIFHVVSKVQGILNLRLRGYFTLKLELKLNLLNCHLAAAAAAANAANNVDKENSRQRVDHSVVTSRDEGEEQFICLVCSRMFRSEAMFRKHQRQAHRSISDAEKEESGFKSTIPLEGQKEGDLDSIDVDPRDLEAPVTTFYSCTVCKMIFSSVAEIQGRMKEWTQGCMISAAM